LSRQVLANYPDFLKLKFVDAYNKKEIEKGRELSGKIIDIIDDMDNLLATRQDFLIGL
jgi:alpha-N-acetylglucosaminidase